MHLDRSAIYARLLRQYSAVLTPSQAAPRATAAYYRLFQELPYQYDRPRVLEFRVDETPEIIATLKGMTPQDAVAYLQSKGIKVTSSWRDMDAAAHQRAFTVAKVASADALTDIRNQLDKAVASGQTFDEFRKEIVPKLENRETALSTGKLNNIYRTNVQSAMMSGRKKQMDATMDQFPYRQFVSVEDNSTTKQCNDLNNKVARADDPFWDKYTPPLHYGCRSNVRTLTEKQFQREGLEATDGRELELLTGMAKEQGFDVAPNMAEWKPDTAKYDPDIKAAIETAIATAALPPTFKDQIKDAKASNIEIRSADQKAIQRLVGNDVNIADLAKGMSFEGGNNVRLRDGSKVAFSHHATKVERNGTDIKINSVFQHGKDTMLVKRTISTNDDGDLSVEHDLLVVPDALQKNGIATALWRDSLAEYKKAGVKEIRVTAALEDGHHTWAKFGFEFADPDDAKPWRRSLARHMVNDHKISQDDADKYVANLNDPRDFQRIHTVKGKTVDGDKWKREIYLETWEGVLKLDDGASHQHLLTYLKLK